MRTLFFLIPLLTDYRTLTDFVHECGSLGLVTAGLLLAGEVFKCFGTRSVAAPIAPKRSGSSVVNLFPMY